MIFTSLILLGLLILGLVLVAWAVRKDIRRRNQHLEQNLIQRVIMSKVESVAYACIYLALFIPTGYFLIQTAFLTRIWIALPMLFLGLFLILFSTKVFFSFFSKKEEPSKVKGTFLLLGFHLGLLLFLIAFFTLAFTFITR